MAENRELALVLKLVADGFQAELKKSQGALGEFNSFIKDWKTQLAAAGTALFAIAKSTANYGEEALKTSQRLGMTVEATTALQYAANLTDVPVSTLEKGLKTLAQNAVEAAQGSGEGARLFSALGISATNASGKIKPLDQLFFEFQDRLKGVANQAQFVDAGVKTFGKSFLDMVPLIKQGSAATKEAMEEGQRFGVVLTKDQAEAANRVNDELKKLSAQLTGVKLSIGNELIPVVRDLIELFRTLGVGTGLSGGLTFLPERFVRINLLLKELQLNSQFLFGTGKDKLSLDMLRGGTDAIEADAKKKLFDFRHPGVLTPDPPSKALVDKFFPTEADEANAAFLREMDRYQKNLQNKEIDIISKRTMEDLNLLFAGANAMRKETETEVERLITDLMADNARTIELINQDFAGDTPAERQEAAGRRIVEQSQKEYAARLKGELAENLQAWIAYGEQVGGSQQLILEKELDLVRVNLAQRLALTTEEAGRLLIAWQNHDFALSESILSRTALTEQQRETLMLQTLANYDKAVKRSSDDFFDGWAEGMRKYVKDTASGFGLAADMARRSFQMVEQSAGKFFFDAMEGRIQRFKDVMTSFLNFAKQIASQLMGQLITKQLAGALAGAAPGFFGSSGANTNFTGDLFSPLKGATGGMIQHFATGGPVLGFGNQDTVPAMLMPGEFVLSRKDVGDIKGGLMGGVQVVVNNYGNNEVQTSTGRGANGQQLIYVTVRDMVKGMMRGGELDGPMGQRFGVNPSPGRR